MERNELYIKLIYCVENIEQFHDLIAKERYFINHRNNSILEYNHNN